MQHIWQWFLQLSATRGGGFGPAPVTFQDLLAWATLMQTEPTPWEIEQIMMIDGVWLKVQAEKSKDKDGKSQAQV